jgi:hypothetical protein
LWGGEDVCAAYLRRVLLHRASPTAAMPLCAGWWAMEGAGV